jgi:hypothetical protein
VLELSELFLVRIPEKSATVIRLCLDPLSFYKICFLAIAYKNWFLNKNWVGVFGDPFLKTINQLLLSSF